MSETASRARLARRRSALRPVLPVGGSATRPAGMRGPFRPARIFSTLLEVRSAAKRRMTMAERAELGSTRPTSADLAGADLTSSACAAGRDWIHEAIAKVEADANRSADTHLLVVPLPPQWGIDLYLKDESTHPTGSLKHRLARSLFLYALCNGWIREGRPVIEASSGSTAVSEAYFAPMLDLPFIAVMPASTSKEKCALIEF